MTSCDEESTSTGVRTEGHFIKSEVREEEDIPFPAVSDSPTSSTVS